jgi:hypothetical protein
MLTTPDKIVLGFGIFSCSLILFVGWLTELQKKGFTLEEFKENDD